MTTAKLKPRKASIQKELITGEFYLRTGINQDRLDLFTDMYCQDKPFDPIKVHEIGDGCYSIIDGRHRHFFFTNIVKATHLDCLVYKGLTKAECMAMAVESASGQALQLTKKDMILTMEKCLQEKMPLSDVRMIFSAALQDGTFSKYMAIARRRVDQRSVGKAMDLMAKNPKMSREEAAEFTGCDCEKIKSALMRRKDGIRIASNQKGATTKKFTHIANHMAGVFGSMIQAYTDSEITADELTDYASHVVLKCKHLVSLATEWQRRVLEMTAPAPAKSECSFHEEKTPAGILMTPKCRRGAEAVA